MGKEGSNFCRSMALSICLLEQLCFTVFTVPSFGILGDFRFAIIPSRISEEFPSFSLLGFREIFRCSAVPRFRLLGFGIIFRLPVILPFRRSVILAFRVALFVHTFISGSIEVITL